MKGKFFIILHNIRSAYNVGAIFRAADGMGADKIYLTGYTPSPNDENKLYQHPSEKMIAKTALGAEKSVPWEKIKNVRKLIEKLKSQKVKIIALEQSKESIDYKKFKPKFPLALIAGSELRGISKTILKKCGQIMEIPMRGKKNSLNVSVALGIAGYEITSKRKK